MKKEIFIQDDKLKAKLIVFLEKYKKIDNRDYEIIYPRNYNREDRMKFIKKVLFTTKECLSINDATSKWIAETKIMISTYEV